MSCSSETIIGSPLAQFVSGGPSALDEVHGRGEPHGAVELDLVDRRGVTVPVLVGVAPLEVDGDHLTCLTFTDLSAQKAQDTEIARLSLAQAERMAALQVAQRALTQQATHDALTGLPNRVLLLDRIDQALAHARRSGRCVAILFVDLDRFKQVNDAKGHAAGDIVLQEVARELVAAMRPMDTVARIGGDEFVLLAPDVDSQLHAVAIGARVIAKLCHRRGVQANGEEVSASVGISVSVGGSGSAEVLLDEADRAMYQAKAAGGGRAAVYDTALNRAFHERSAVRKMLESALDERRVLAHYQPVIDLTTGTVAGFEALARISEPDGTVLPPADFIPVAEESGLVVPLGAQVLEMACFEAEGWKVSADGHQRLTVAVNLSARQFESGDLARIVQSTLEVSGLDPTCLHLELTETAVIDLRPDTLRQLEAIRDLGVQIGLDDFGTGYASLTHLRRLPVTFVKIDQTFVKGLGTDKGDGEIVSAVVDLAANLSLRSIAEGVETEDQLLRLREFGCDQAQGYLFARPLTPRHVATALDHPPW